MMKGRSPLPSPPRPAGNRGSVPFWWLVLVPALLGWRWPGEIDELCRAGAKAFAQGRFDAAERALGEALLARPSSPEIAYNLGTVALGRADYGRAVELFGQGLDHARQPALANRLHYNRGNAYFRLNQIEEAAADYKAALDLDPTDADADHNYRLCLELLKNRPPAGGGGAGEGGEGQAGGEQGAGGGGGVGQAAGPNTGGASYTESGVPIPSDAEVESILRKLEQEERDLRPYFKPYQSVFANRNPADIFSGLNGAFGSENETERDW